MPTNTLERQREENTRLVTVLLDVSSTLGQLIKQEKPVVTSERQIAKLAGLCREVEDVTAAQPAIGHEIRTAISDARIAELSRPHCCSYKEATTTPQQPQQPFSLDFSSCIRRAIDLPGNVAELVGLVRDSPLLVIIAPLVCGIYIVVLVFAQVVIYAVLVRVYDWLILPVWPLLEQIYATISVLVLESDWAKRVGEAVTQAFEYLAEALEQAFKYLLTCEYIFDACWAKQDRTLMSTALVQMWLEGILLPKGYHLNW
ncbi:hypothetical protein HDK64DRAFT_256086 [Phyllosticta capitalensis]